MTQCSKIRLIPENGEMMADEKNPQLPIGPLIDLRSHTRNGIDYVIVSPLRVQCVFSFGIVLYLERYLSVHYFVRYTVWPCPSADLIIFLSLSQQFNTKAGTPRPKGLPIMKFCSSANVFSHKFARATKSNEFCEVWQTEVAPILNGKLIDSVCYL